MLTLSMTPSNTLISSFSLAPAYTLGSIKPFSIRYSYEPSLRRRIDSKVARLITPRKRIYVVILSDAIFFRVTIGAIRTAREIM